MSGFQLLAVIGLVFFNNFAAAGNYTFRTWFEAPQAVIAGETFRVSMFAEMTEDNLRPPLGSGFFTWIAGSIEVGGDLAAFSQISEVMSTELQIAASRGTADGEWLRDFSVFQHPNFPEPPFLTSRNPIEAVVFEVTTAPGSRGTMNLDFRRPFDVAFESDVPVVQWWVWDGGNIISTMNGDASHVALSGTVRVIPAPASLALLAPLALANTRRHR